MSDEQIIRPRNALIQLIDQVLDKHFEEWRGKASSGLDLYRDSLWPLLFNSSSSDIFQHSEPNRMIRVLRLGANDNFGLPCIFLRLVIHITINIYRQTISNRLRWEHEQRKALGNRREFNHISSGSHLSYRARSRGVVCCLARRKPLWKFRNASSAHAWHACGSYTVFLRALPGVA